jgi:hypothetical protein
MIRLHIMLNNRRRFVFSAAMGALLVLFAGGANALAAVTVWHVNKSSSNATCTISATTCNTIGSAVSAAVPGDAIIVGPGTYAESVTISTNAVSLLGAQAGNDAREDRRDPAEESIVDATGKANPAFIVNANYVVIDGFTVTGGTAATPTAGILVGSLAGTPYLWAQILNNVLEKNGTGVYLYRLASSTSPPSPSVVIEHNLFRNNSAGTGGSVGFGIYANAVTFPVITENEFTGNETAAILVSGGSNAIITNNTSKDDGAFMANGGTNECLFSHNQGRNFGHKGVLPVVVGPYSIYPDAAVDIGPGNSNLVISDNDLERGEGRISNGIAFTAVFAATPLGTTPTLT